MKEPITGYGVTTNTIQLVQKDDKLGFLILLETPIREEKRIKILLREALRAASIAEHNASTMTDEEVIERVEQLEKQDSIVTVSTENTR